MKSKILVFLLVLSFMLVGATSSAFADVKYLPGVNPADPNSYMDAEKSPYTTEDNNMCWAAAASNALAWTGWYDVYGDDEDAIFGYFQDSWADGGSTPEWGWNWWFTGVDNTPPPTPKTNPAHVDVPGSGNFYTQAEFDANYHGWLRPATGEGTTSFDPDGSAANSTIKVYINSGYGTTIGIFGYDEVQQKELQHGLTVWGYQWDGSGDINGIYVTDSDDNKYLPDYLGVPTMDPEDILNDMDYYALALGSDIGSFAAYEDCWFLGGDYEWWWIGFAQALDVYMENDEGPGPGEPIPEPATILLLGSGLFGLFGIGRRKFKRS